MFDRFKTQKTRNWQRVALAMVLLSLGSAGLFAQTSSSKTFLPEMQNGAPRSGVVWSFTDLDGDLLRDSVRTSSSGFDRLGYIYTVEFKMSAGAFSSPIRVHGPDSWGLDITARDVDGDRDLDLVVTGGVFGQPLGVWINDGNGHFAQADVSNFPSWIWLEGESFHAPRLRTTTDAIAVLSNSSSIAPEYDSQGRPLRVGALVLRGLDSPVSDNLFTDGSRPRAPPSLQLAS